MSLTSLQHRLHAGHPVVQVSFTQACSWAFCSSFACAALALTVLAKLAEEIDSLRFSAEEIACK